MLRALHYCAPCSNDCSLALSVYAANLLCIAGLAASLRYCRGQSLSPNEEGMKMASLCERKAMATPTPLVFVCMCYLCVVTILVSSATPLDPCFRIWRHRLRKLLSSWHVARKQLEEAVLPVASWLADCNCWMWTSQIAELSGCSPLSSVNSVCYIALALPLVQSTLNVANIIPNCKCVSSRTREKWTVHFEEHQNEIARYRAYPCLINGSGCSAIIVGNRCLVLFIYSPSVNAFIVLP